MSSKAIAMVNYCMRRTKYHAKKVNTVSGERFDSQLEMNRYLYLKQQLERGVISELRRQVAFNLIPRQYVFEERVGKKGQHLKPKQRVAEYQVDYIADFTYDYDDGTQVHHIIEDAKGVPTAEYIIKRKLMRLQGHPIVEVRTPAQVIEPPVV